MGRAFRVGMAFVLAALWVLAPVAPASAGGGFACHGPFGDETTTEIQAHAVCFSPTVSRIDVGDTVRWFNGHSEASHTVTAVAESFSAGTGDLSAGDSLAATFDEPGVYPYACLLHPGMAGAVVVGDGRTAARDAADSSAPAAVLPPPAATGPTPGTEPAWYAVVAAGLLVMLLGGALALRRLGTIRAAASRTVDL